ncbi:SGNH/GDSL hydrolase family protein [Nocardia sp. NPDC058705]|uniref:SGNH/GDSL hydrolase family protein n=1 Tax=Nocardia sp. NPDC058705 TaxID=3346609 RepID=UPI00367488BD
MKRFLLLLISAIAWLTAVPGVADGSPIRYVALGDSYSSAPGMLTPVPGSPLLCTRSRFNYPNVLAAATGWELVDRSCASAMTEHMTTAQYPDQPPQFDALDAGTQIVTYQAGGDDNGMFQTLVLSCVGLNIANAFNIGAPCRDTYGSRFSDEIAAGAPKIGATIAEIHTRAPNAQVYVLGYPAVLPETGSCWPQVPLSDGDVAYTRDIEKHLNAVLREQAAANGATYIDLYTPTLGHDTCQDAAIRWVEPPIPSHLNANPVHPNATGQVVTADIVRAVIGR